MAKAQFAKSLVPLFIFRALFRIKTIMYVCRMASQHLQSYQRCYQMDQFYPLKFVQTNIVLISFHSIS